jgi:hypothetical protein
MKLKNKIIIFFSLTFTLVLGIALLAVYFSMAERKNQHDLPAVG